MKFYLPIVLLFISCLAINAQADFDLLRFPAINANGQQIAFSFQGDIWVADLDGKNPRRITIHESYESYPEWNPTTDELLFHSNRYGNTDIFVTNKSGSTPKRLTYYSGSDGAGKWINGDEIVFSTSRTFREVEREGEVFKMNKKGGTPLMMLEALGNSPAVSPDGRYVAMVKGNCRVTREAYKGPANRNVWIYDTQTQQFEQITTFDGQDVQPDWGANNELFFLSAANGRYNLHKVTIQNGKAAGEPVALTKFKDEGIRHFDVSANGAKIVFERKNGIYSMDAKANARATEIKVDLPGDFRFDPVESMTLSSITGGGAISPNGKQVALVLRGDLFIVPEDKEKTRAIQVTSNPAREEDVSWLNDSTLVFVSDRQGNRDLFLLRSTDTNEPDLYKTFKREVIALTNTAEEESNIQISPDGKQIAFNRGRGKLVVADIAADGQLSNERLMQDGWATANNVRWSPDSKWLSYDMPNLDFNREVYIHAADNSQKPVNVSMHPKSDSRAVWSADGSKLGFLSSRNNGNSDVWFVWLKKADWEKTRRDWEEDDSEKKKPQKGGSKEVVIDFENIHDRLVQVSLLPGNEGNLMISKDGETFYYSTNGGGRQGFEGPSSFYSVKWDGSDQKVLVRNRRIFAIDWDKAGKSIYFVSSGRLNKMNAASGKAASHPFSGRMKLDRMAERAQIFDDGWRALNDGFYDPQFHGEDFTALKATYRPRALAASTAQDFRDMFNHMLGQLNASHMGMSGPSPEETQRDRTGLLGVEWTSNANGLEVKRVIPNSPADRTESKLNVGDVVTTVNGESVGGDVNFYSLFEGTVNEKVLLTVRNAQGEDREVIIRPTGSLRRALYENWVATQKELTEKYSNGRLGYIHIQGMNWPSFERFERELTASGLGKEGIVIDVRFNGGGWTTDMLMAVLNVKQHSYTIPRGAAKSLEKENPKFRENYPYGERLPFASLTRPSVALCNHTSYSNAEIFSHAYKTLDLGTLVGEPTFGAVISTGSHGLKDGSRVRMPYRAWYVKATGENMEHGPAVPDVIVYNKPETKAQGEDLQLKKAVEVLLGQLDGKGSEE